LPGGKEKSLLPAGKSLGKSAPAGAEPFCCCKTLELLKQLLRFLNPIGSEKALGKTPLAKAVEKGLQIYLNALL